MVSASWKDEPLGNIATLQRGFDLPSRLRKPGEVPIVTSSGTEGRHREAKVKGPGVVTGRYGTIGEVFFIRDDFWPLNTTLYVRDFHGNDPLFISYLLRTIDFHTHSGKSGVPGVNRNDLHEIVVSLPSMTAEQKAIAKALSNADGLVESLERLLAKKRQIKQGTMQELLTGKKRLPGFEEPHQYKHTDMGVIPANWESIALSELCAFITKGSTPTTYGFEWKQAGIPFLRSECVAENGLDLGQSMFISPQAHAALRRSEVDDGDILVTITGNVGRVIMLSGVGKANINQHIARIRVTNPRAVAEFVFYYLSQPAVRSYFSSITTGQAYPQISLKQVRDARISAPPTKTEQQAIATVLLDMDAEISALDAKLGKARNLKQGMTQELLTGRIRLV